MIVANLIDSIIQFFLMTSALLLVLGAVCFLIVNALKIHGKSRLWIFSMLILMPLAYPIQALLPNHAKVNIPLEAIHAYFPQPMDSSPGNDSPLADDLSSEEFFGARLNQLLLTDTRPLHIETPGIERSSAGDASPFKVNWKTVVILAWSVSFLFFLTRFVLMVIKSRRLLQVADPVKDPQILTLFNQCSKKTGLRTPPRLLLVDHLPAPMVMGFFIPSILLPRHLLQPEFREGLRFTLLHELKHVQRRDNWWLLVESLVGAAYFFHPVIYWAKKRIHEEWEYLCDYHVIRVTNKSASYADFLLHEIWNQGRGIKPALALPFISGVSKTAKRVHAILGDTKPTIFALIRGRIAVSLFFLSFISLLLCSVAPSAQEQAKPFYEINFESTKRQGGYDASSETDDIENDTLSELSDQTPPPKQALPQEVTEADSYLNRTTDILRVKTEAGRDGFDKEDRQARFSKEPAADGKNAVIDRPNTRPQIESMPIKRNKSNPGQVIDEPSTDVDTENRLLVAEYEDTKTVDPETTPKAETEVGKYLGQPVRHLVSYKVRGTRVLDDQTILFIMRDGGLFLNRLPYECFGLYMANGFIYKPFNSNKFSKHDSIQAISLGSFPGSTSYLGDFFPFRYEGEMADAIERLKNSLLEELVAEGAFKEAVSKGGSL